MFLLESFLTKLQLDEATDGSAYVKGFSTYVTVITKGYPVLVKREDDTNAVQLSATAVDFTTMQKTMWKYRIINRPAYSYNNFAYKNVAANQSFFVNQFTSTAEDESAAFASARLLKNMELNSETNKEVPT